MNCECAAREKVHDHKPGACARDAIMRTTFRAIERNLCMQCFREMRQAGLNIISLEVFPQT